MLGINNPPRRQAVIECKRCKSTRVVKNGFANNKQRYLCKECGYVFTEGDRRVKPKIKVIRAWCVLLYSLAKASFNMLAKLFNTWPSVVYCWICQAANALDETKISDKITEIEFDEMWHFIQKKTNKLWVIKAVDRKSRRTIAWLLGKRDAKTFARLYDKVAHLKNCTFYTDDWDAFAKILPKERHIIGKEHTVTIERDNSNTRHHLGRFTRRTKVVSKKTEMVDLTIRLWHALTSPEIFSQFQTVALSIFR
jgi:insertion element IS1 protein InsB